tara:strand:- start:3562 stop:3831 length:270 start_codon:yes stop_codon:yes gene_type:complete
MKDKTLGYKIKDPDTGLYAISISKNKWGKFGRTWSRMCDVTRVINNGFRVSSDNEAYNALYDKILTLEIVELSEKRRYSTIHCIDKIKV